MRVPLAVWQASLVSPEVRERAADNSYAVAGLRGSRVGRRAGVARQAAVEPLDRRGEPLLAVLRRRNGRRLVWGCGTRVVRNRTGSSDGRLFLPVAHPR